MEISGTSNASLLDAVIARQNNATEREIKVLQRAQDVQQQQGEAAVQLIEAAGLGQTVDVRA